jgi:hypothetical protein
METPSFPKEALADDAETPSFPKGALADDIAARKITNLL